MLRKIVIKNHLFDSNAVYWLINDASQKAPNLKDLIIGNNQIMGEFDLGKLQLLKNLKGFSIDQNAINKFVCSATEDMPSVDLISLDGNKIRLIDFEIFEKFPNLETLSLSHNKLVGTIDLGKLQPMLISHIALDNNKITKIANTATENIPSVTQIDLNGNKLTSVDLKVFAKFTNLNSLQLNGNQLTFIDGYPMARKREKITKPYSLGFWFNIDDEEMSCPGPKNVHYKELTCCYQ